MRSAGTISATMYEMDPRGPQSASQSAFPSLRGGFAPIEETHADPGMSPSTSVTSSWASNLDSLSTPSTTPPLEEDEFQAPYADGPRELIPGVWIGAEDSTHHFDIWGRGSSTVAVVNVAQELENPFADGADLEAIAAGWTSYKGKAVVALTNHAADSTRPNIEYAHLRWSHGEGGLCDIPASAAVSQLIDPASPDAEDTNSEKWRFWEAICWIEAHRRAGIPVMIHCQCGVSRSATLAVAYIMSVAAAGLVPETLGQLRTMQNAYDFVKGRSPWIGPNVS
jgi:tyrosine-protein phosphatase